MTEREQCDRLARMMGLKRVGREWAGDDGLRLIQRSPDGRWWTNTDTIRSDASELAAMRRLDNHTTTITTRQCCNG